MTFVMTFKTSKISYGREHEKRKWAILKETHQILKCKNLIGRQEKDFTKIRG
jgi:hypothetical protein